MSSLLNGKDDISKKISEIDEKLSSNEKNIIYQCEEIIKAENLISQYQEILKTKSERLQKCISEKEILQVDKFKLLKLIEENQLREMEFNVKQDISKSKQSLFDESYEIKKSVKSLKFYRAITTRLNEALPNKIIDYVNQTAIPNDLKASTTERSMRLMRIDVVGEYSLESIVGRSVTMSLDIHLSKGIGELLSVRGENPHAEYNVTHIDGSKTYSIHQSQTEKTRFVLMVTSVPLEMCFDVHCNERCQLASMSDLTEPRGYSSVSLSSKYQDSFLKRSLSFAEIRKNLLFLDAKFAISVEDNLVPVELAVIDFDNKILVNTVMCPREQIRDYREELNGISEQKLFGVPDSNEIMKYFYTIILDKILIGHELENKIRDLKIDLKYICGIKDLRSSLAVKEIFGSGKSSYTLNEISVRILKKPVIQSETSTLQRTRVMRQIYTALESNYQRSMSNANNSENLRMWGPLPKHLTTQTNQKWKKMKM